MQRPGRPFDPMSVARRESLGDQLLATFTATSDQLHQLCQV